MNDCEHIVSSSRDNSLSIWSIEKKSEIVKLFGHKSCIIDFVFSTNNEFIISLSNDATIRLWNVNTRKKEDFIETNTENNKFMLITNDDKFLITAGDYDYCNIIIWNLHTKGEVASYLHKFTSCISISSNNQLLATGSRDFSIKIWSFIEKCEISTISGHFSPITDIGFISEKIIISSGVDSRIMVSDFNTTQQYLIKLLFEVKVVSLTHNCKYLIAGWDDKIIRVSYFKEKLKNLY